METALNTLQSLQEAPIPNLLVIGGTIFLLLAFLGKIGGWVELSPSRQAWSGVIGAILLTVGVTIFSTSGTERVPDEVSATPTKGSVTTVGADPTRISVPDDTPIPTAPAILVTPQESVHRYFQLVGQDCDAAWELLSDRFQRSQHRNDINHYKRWCEALQRATVLHASQSAHSENQATVSASVDFTWLNGKSETLSFNLDLVYSESIGEWLIDLSYQ